MDHKTVIHTDSPTAMCYGPVRKVYRADLSFIHPEHGTVVECGICGRTGIVPEPGHELLFLPEGTRRTEDGSFVWEPPGT